MSLTQRVRAVGSALLMLVCAALLIREPEDGYTFAIFILSVSLLLYGLRQLWYYFTMAVHMVGGKRILYRGMILFDLGIFSVVMADSPDAYVILYLLAFHLFAGVVDALRAMEAKKLGASWRLRMASGAVNISVAVLCLCFTRSRDILMYIYAAGLAESAIFRLLTAFRRNAIVYVHTEIQS